MVSEEEGAELVRLARRAVETYLQESVIVRPLQDSEKAGVFVTLSLLGGNNEEQLRGCIGYPLPEKKLHQSVVEAAIAAATEDPRFPPIDRKELERLLFEVSILTRPEEIRTAPADYKKEIKLGRDGLIFCWAYGSGLLLPQVPVELKWEIGEYLANICYKAGAPADAWLDPASKLYKFQALVFKELEPNGRITRLEL